MLFIETDGSMGRDGGVSRFARLRRMGVSFVGGPEFHA